MAKKGTDWLYIAISEIAFYMFLYYAQILLNVASNLWISSLVLWVLLNLSIVFCPVLNPRRK